MNEYLIILNTNSKLALSVNGGKREAISLFKSFDVAIATALVLRLTGLASACEIHRVFADGPPVNPPQAGDKSTLCLSVDRNAFRLKKVRVQARPQSRKARTEDIPSSEAAPGKKKRHAKRKNPRWVHYSKGQIALDIAYSDEPVHP